MKNIRYGEYQALSQEQKLQVLRMEENAFRLNTARWFGYNEMPAVRYCTDEQLLKIGDYFFKHRGTWPKVLRMLESSDQAVVLQTVDKFTVAAGVYNAADEAAGVGGITYKYREDFNTLHDAIHSGLLNVMGEPVVEMHYTDRYGRRWSLDVVEEKDEE